MKKHIFYSLSIAFGISAHSICMDEDQDKTHPLENIVVEKIYTLKDAFRDGVKPEKNRLCCSEEGIDNLEDLPQLRNNWQLNTLTDIDFSYNNFVKLPKVIFFECPALRRLNVSHNNLKEIDPNLPAHQNLFALYLHNNAFEGTFHLARLLNTAPIMYLTLHNNPGITDLGVLYHKAPHLKELWVDYTLPDYVKQHIAQKCPNLEAEICNLGTHVQDEHSYTRYTKECREASCDGACWGLCGVCSGFVGIGVSLGLGFRGLPFLGHMVAATAAGLIIGPIIGSQIAVYCCLDKNKPRKKVVLTKTIRPLPPMLEQFICEKPSSESESSDAHNEEIKHDSWSTNLEQESTNNTNHS